jgi:pimeloyl-ACP methyl ester carboxylesterase
VNGNTIVPTFISETFLPGTKPDSDGRIAVFITGAGLPSIIWTRFRDAIGYRSILFDREGLGWSELGKPSSQPGKAPNMSSCPIPACAHLIAVVDSIKDDIPRDIILFGHSLGGAFTLACAPDLDRHLRRTSKWSVWKVILLESITPQALSKPAFALLPLAAGALYRAAEFGLLEHEIDIFQLSRLPKSLVEPARRSMLSLRHWAGFAKEMDSLQMVPACLSHKDHLNFPTFVLTAEGRESVELDYFATRDAVPGSDHMSMLTDENIVKQTISRIGLYIFASLH